MRVRAFAAFLLAVAFFVITAGVGCSDDPIPGEKLPLPGKKDGGGDGSSGGNGGDTICLLNNCDLDRDCTDCANGASTCFQQEHRCVACGPNANGKACGTGSTCTKYGACVPNGVTCAEDAAGVPTITCKNTADCGACGPKFQVCNEATGKCVGCSDTNTANCQSTDVCKGEACIAKCPANCTKDDDCGDCGATGKEAHACNKHVCSTCSSTKPCADGGSCDLDHGTCIAPCGLGRANQSNCEIDGNCSGCTGTTKCKLPVNGGDGVCAAPVTGCSDLGKGTIVLPDPFSRFTNTCSTDADCSNVGADLNVGKILRDATGLDLIKDGNLSYSMHACASVDVLDTSCGICVPCKTDTDCTDIDASKVAGDIFGPLGSIGASVLLDKAFGPNDHKIHMYCQNVVKDYGVCAPCPSFLTRCAQTDQDVPTSGTCTHDVCTEGATLGVNCDPCVVSVCEKDPYCCIKEWDYQCKVDVDLYCSQKTCEPDKCIYRPAGWYCFSDPTKGGYRCAGEEGQEQIAEGEQCQGTGQVCKTNGTGPKDPAILCTTEGDSVPGCPVGSMGKPKCFDP